MRRLMVDEVRRAVRGRWRWPGKLSPTEGVSIDSRTAGAGDVFVALRGPKFDAHDFLTDATAAGCVAAVVDVRAEIPDEVLAGFAGGVISVADTTAALGHLAHHCREHLSATVVAVTGSNGKTTVKGMIHHILSRKLHGSPSPGSFNNAVGVPLTLFEVAPEDDYVICEIGTNSPGEVAELARIARPDIAVITSVARTHLEGLGDLEHVAVEKAALLGGLGPAGLAVVWADSKPLARAVRAYDARMIRFGRDDSAELRLTQYEPTPGGGRFQVNGHLWVELAIPGAHSASNALAAIAVAQRFGFEQADAAEALRDYTTPKMRLEVVPAGKVTIINDAYNSNPASLRAAAEALMSYQAARRVLVAGDMLELGDRSVELHVEVGRALGDCGIDLVVGVGELGRHVAEGAAAAGGGTEVIDSVDSAMTGLPKLLCGGDVVLLKASRGVAMERLVGPIQQADVGRRKPRTQKRPRRTGAAKRTRKKGPGGAD